MDYRTIALSSIDGHIKAMQKFSKCKQDARTFHDMAGGQICLMKIFDLITDKEKEKLLNKIADAYEETISMLYS